MGESKRRIRTTDAELMVIKEASGIIGMRNFTMVIIAKEGCRC